VHCTAGLDLATAPFRAATGLSGLIAHLGNQAIVYTRTGVDGCLGFVADLSHVIFVLMQCANGHLTSS